MNHTLSLSFPRSHTPRGAGATAVLLTAVVVVIGLVILSAGIAIAGPGHFDSAVLTLLAWVGSGWGAMIR